MESTATEFSNPHLRVTFCWESDRWGHEVAVATDGGWSTVLIGDARGDDAEQLLLPVHQELVVRREGSVAHAFALGRMGSHHFGISYELPSDRPELRIQVSDRVARDTSCLGIRWLYAVPAAAQGSGSLPKCSGAHWDLVRAPGRIGAEWLVPDRKLARGTYVFDLTLNWC